MTIYYMTRLGKLQNVRDIRLMQNQHQLEKVFVEVPQNLIAFLELSRRKNSI